MKFQLNRLNSHNSSRLLCEFFQCYAVSPLLILYFRKDYDFKQIVKNGALCFCLLTKHKNTYTDHTHAFCIFSGLMFLYHRHDCVRIFCVLFLQVTSAGMWSVIKFMRMSSHFINRLLLLCSNISYCVAWYESGCRSSCNLQRVVKEVCQSHKFILYELVITSTLRSVLIIIECRFQYVTEMSTFYFLKTLEFFPIKELD